MAKKIKVKGVGAVKDVNPGDVWEAGKLIVKIIKDLAKPKSPKI